MDQVFCKCLEKTLYCGTWDSQQFPFSMTDLAVEFFQDISPHAIGKLDCESASTVVNQESVSVQSIAMSMIYARRLQRRRLHYVNNMSSSNLFLISMVVASKYLYDEGIDEEVVNSEWAENSHVDLYELNAMEIEFLEAMNWELFITKEDFDRAMNSIETSIAWRHGAKVGWFPYTGMCLLIDYPHIQAVLWNALLDWMKVVVVSAAAYTAGVLMMVGSTVLVTHFPPVSSLSGSMDSTLGPSDTWTSFSSDQLDYPATVVHPLSGRNFLPTLDFPENDERVKENLRPVCHGVQQNAREGSPVLFHEPWPPVHTCPYMADDINSQLVPFLVIKSQLTSCASNHVFNFLGLKSLYTGSGCCKLIDLNHTQRLEKLNASIDIYICQWRCFHVNRLYSISNGTVGIIFVVIGNASFQEWLKSLTRWTDVREVVHSSCLVCRDAHCSSVSVECHCSDDDILRQIANHLHSNHELSRGLFTSVHGT